MESFKDYLDRALPTVSFEQQQSDKRIEDYDIYDEIAKLIVTEREKKGWTQKQLAEFAGISQANISKFENGNSHPTLLTLKKIADACGKHLTVSFSEEELF